MSEVTTNIESNDVSAEIAKFKAMVSGETKPIEKGAENLDKQDEDLDTGEKGNKNQEIENAEENKGKEDLEKNPNAENPNKETQIGDEPKKPSNEDIVAFLKEQNINVESIDDLRKKVESNTTSNKDDVDEETKSAVKKLEIKKWAIENKKIDPKKLEQFEEDNKLSDIELAYKVYHAERQHENNPNTDEPYTDEELREEFQSENYLNEDDDSPLKKRRLKNISLIAQTYKYDNYKDLSELEKSYDNEVFSAEEIKELNNTINISKTKIIEDGLSYSIKDDLGNDVVINIPITKKLIDEIQLSRNEIEDISDTNDISAKIKERYLIKNFGKVAHEIATSYHSKKILDLKASSIGIENRKAEMGKNAEDEIDIKLKKLIEKHTVSN